MTLCFHMADTEYLVQLKSDSAERQEVAIRTALTEWRKRLGVEPSPPAKQGAAGFEDREGHRAPFASARRADEGPLSPETARVGDELDRLDQHLAQIPPASPPPGRVGPIEPAGAHEDRDAGSRQFPAEGEARAPRVQLGSHHRHAAPVLALEQAAERRRLLRGVVGFLRQMMMASRGPRAAP